MLLWLENFPSPQIFSSGGATLMDQPVQARCICRRIDEHVELVVEFAKLRQVAFFCLLSDLRMDDVQMLHI